MKLQTRTALVPIVTVSVLGIVLYGLTSRLIVSSFDALETDALQRQVTRVQNSVSNLESEHALKIVDWAQWDKTYEFMESLDSEYIDQTLNSLTLGALGFDSVFYLTPSLELRYGVQVDPDGNVVPVTESMTAAVSSILRKNQSESGIRGIAELEGSQVLFAAAPILPNKADQSSRGYLIATKKLDLAAFDTVKHVTNLLVEFWTKEQFAQAETLPGAAKTALAGEVSIEIKSPELVHAYGVVKGIADEAAILFRVDDSRRIMSSGIRVQWFAVFVLLGSSLVAILLLVRVINSTATKRIEQFSAQVREIASSSSPDGRVKEKLRYDRSLRYRTVGGVFLTFAVTTVIAGTVLNQYFMRGFEQVEVQSMEDNLERATRALNGRLDKLKSKAIDWGQWDDSFAFIEDRNEAYREANLGFDTLGTMDLKYVFYVDLAGQVVESRVVDADATTAAEAQAEVINSFAVASKQYRVEEPAAGFLALPNEPLLAGASPIVDSERSQPSRGHLVFAARADETLAAALSEQVRLPISFVAASTRSAQERVSISPTSLEVIRGRSLITDSENNPVFAVQVESPRQIYQRGSLASRILSMYFLFGGLVCSLITLFAVDRNILKRLGKLGLETSEIRRLGSAASQVSSEGRDEISDLAESINSMLVALQNTQMELSNARTVAENANAAKSMFIARVSHELRTPVGGIVGINRIIKKEPTLPRSVRELVEMGDATAHGLLSIIDEILDFAKAESGELTFERISFDVREVVRQTMQTIAGRLEGKYRPEEQDRVQLVCDVASDVPERVIGDPTKMRQILTNLLGNAVKFTTQGHITLKVETRAIEQGGGLKLSVTDSGVGIPEEKLEAVFDPFKQAEASTARKFQGTGLGLSIVKQFVDGLGGTVAVKSRLGRGSTFAVELPFETDVTQGAAQAATADGEAPQSYSRRPSEPVLLAQPGVGSETICRNLSELAGVTVEQIDSTVADNRERALVAVRDADLLVLSEESLLDSAVWEGLKSRLSRSSSEACTVALLKPSAVELRERLYQLGLKYVLPTPVLAVDIFNAFQGRLPDLVQESVADEEVLKIGRRLKVLVVDDVITNRLFLEDLLMDAGHEVTSVSDGTEMVEKLTGMINGTPNADHYDIVLTDVSMAIMNGDEATRAIRELERLSFTGIHVPIVAVTAHAFLEEQQKILESGVDGVLTKPLQPTKMAEEFSRLLSR